MTYHKRSNILRSLRIVWQSSPKWSVINAVLVIFKGVMPLLLIFIIKVLVDEVSASIIAEHNVDVVYQVLIVAGLVFALNAVLNSVAGIVRQKHSYYISDTVQDLVHKLTTQLDFVNYDDFNFQNIYYRAINEASFRPSKIYYGFIGLIQNGISLVLIGALLASLHWSIILLLLVVSVPVIYVRLRYSRKIFSFNRKHTEDERYVNYHNKLLTGKEFAKELRVFGLSDLFKNRYEKEKNTLRSKQFDLLKMKTMYEFLVQLLTAFTLIMVFSYISIKAIEGNISQGEMVMFFLAIYRAYSFLQDLLGGISSLYEDGLFLRNLFEFIDFDVVKYSGERAATFPKTMKQGISVENLDFKYPNSSRSLFSQLNFTINAGETVALVGANGAGKSTIVKLLCGLYEPEQGSVKIDGINLSSINRESIAENISVVFQDFMLYNVSARENIWFGDVKKDKASNDLYGSAKESGVHQLIENLPKGYETTLGTLFKDSEMLSVGEWQRIALSRSFFNNAQLVILDEPTSSLDAFTEANLIENFKAITKGRTAIIVSHRMSTIHLADRIIVLDDHGVAEEGSASDLLEKKGVFFQMLESIKKK